MPSESKIQNTKDKSYFSKKINLEQGLSLKSIVIDIQKIDVNSYVGYGKKYRAENPGYVAVVPIG